MSKPYLWLERCVFGFRLPILAALVLLTIFFAYEMYDIEMDTNLKKMVPLEHPYIRNFFKHRNDLHLGNDIRIAVENTQGDIFNADFLDVVHQISDEAFYLPGVDKGRMKSLWTPNVRWSEVDTEGIRGGEIIPPTYDASPAAVEQVRKNVLKSDLIGTLVSDDMHSTMIYLPLIDTDASSRNADKIDYKLLSDQIETGIRDRFQNDDVHIHIIGFAKKVGDLIAAVKTVLVFFVAMLLITFHLLVFDSRCVRSAGVVLVGAVMAVIWQLGIVTLLHKAMVHVRDTPFWHSLIQHNPTLEPIQFGMDPYSMLVPFLVFAIAISHGVQSTNEMTRRVAMGEDRLQASKNTFRVLFIPGLLALLSDAIGFVTLWFVDIGVIRELAITASVGVAVIVLTKLIFVPIVLSYIGVGERAVQRRTTVSPTATRLWSSLSKLVRPGPAWLSLVVALGMTAAGLSIRQGLQIGDLDPGVPELRADSRYNKDNAFITRHFSVSADVLVVMAETKPGVCSTYPVLSRVDRFMGYMGDVKGVNAVISLPTVSKHITVGFNEGNLKWASLPEDPAALNGTMIYLPDGFTNVNCSMLPVYIFLADHKADTLERAVQAVAHYPPAKADAAHVRYLLASGSAGVEAATNQTIARAEVRILLMVYGVVSLMVWLSFRSWRAVMCIILPLVMTSILCESLMTLLHIGVKVATLPVIALGVGIGVDYGIYLFARMHSFLQAGHSLQSAYFEALKTTGRSVVFTCVTLSLSVGFWIFSHIKFQADMGTLLTFMFLWNMVGAIWLLPVLAYFFFPAHRQAPTCANPAVD